MITSRPVRRGNNTHTQQKCQIALAAGARTKGIVYSPADILAIVRTAAAAKLGVREGEISLMPTDLGPIGITRLEPGKALGPFFRLKLGALKVADRIDDDGLVVMEDPFHFRGEYPVRVTVEQFLKLRGTPLREVRAEFIRLAHPFPPRGWEKLCGISARIALSQMKKQRKEGA